MAASGHDCNFLSEPADALKCLICLTVARDPRQHEECGKLFCSECIEKYGRKRPCPNCKKIGPFYKDRRGVRDIAELQVKCDNVERKCEWVGTVGTLQEHVNVCKFALVPCPKECKDDNDQVKRFMRKDLDEHLTKECLNRDCTCEYCGEKGTYAEITQIHDEICLKKIVSCPNSECTAPDMERQQVKEHIAKCEHTVIACKYEIIGCETELKRKDMAAHEEDDKLHLHMAIDSAVEFKNNLQDLKQTLKTGEAIKFKLTEYQESKDSNKEVQSPSYYIFPNGYRMLFEVDPNGYDDYQGTHVSVYAQIVKGKHDAELKWPFSGKITFTLLNQLEDKNHHQMTSEGLPENNFQVGDFIGCPDFIRHSKLGFNQIRNTQYLKDDTLYFRMSVEVANHKFWLE